MTARTGFITGTALALLMTAGHAFATAPATAKPTPPTAGAHLLLAQADGPKKPEDGTPAQPSPTADTPAQPSPTAGTPAGAEPIPGQPPAGATPPAQRPPAAQPPAAQPPANQPPAAQPPVQAPRPPQKPTPPAPPQPAPPAGGGAAEPIPGQPPAGVTPPAPPPPPAQRPPQQKPAPTPTPPPAQPQPPASPPTPTPPPASGGGAPEPVRDTSAGGGFGAIGFAFGSDRIADAAAGEIEAIASGIRKVLERDPAASFAVEGHADAVGPRRVNQDLSERRARALASALSARFGIPADRLNVEGRGETELKIETRRPAAENRRVTVRQAPPLR